MQRIDEAIDVHVPAAKAYEQWARFDEYQLFVENVVEVKREGDRLLWIAEVAGRRQAWEARIVVEAPPRRLSWVAAEGPIDTDLRVEPLGPTWTRVYFHERIHDTVLLEAATLLGLSARRARADLRRFKELVEKPAFGGLRPPGTRS